MFAICWFFGHKLKRNRQKQLEVMMNCSDSTSVTEVTQITRFGVWILTARGKELFMPYDHFPWFKGQSKQSVCYVEEPSPEHFYWPDLDVDLSERMIEQPEQCPLVARA
jgi:hypothetical protein